jgi:hypothetical protein
MKRTLEAVMNTSEIRSAQDSRERTKLINYWAQMFSVSRRTAERWFDASLRPAFSPLSESGPFMRLSQAASLIRVQPQALRKFGQRSGKPSELRLAEVKIITVPWSESRKTIFTYYGAAGLMASRSADTHELEAAGKREEMLVEDAISAGAKPIVRVCRRALARLFNSRPRRMSRSLPGWIDCKPELKEKEYLVTSAEEAKAIKDAGVEEHPRIKPHLFNTPEENTSFGHWLYNLASSKAQPAGRPRCTIRLNEKLLLRLTFSEDEHDPVDIEAFGRGNKVATRIVVEFNDGTRTSVSTANHINEH